MATSSITRQKEQPPGNKKIGSRECALQILMQIEKDNFAVESIYSVFKKNRVSETDRSFIRELVYGTTKMKRRLDYELAYLISKNFAKIPSIIKNILRMGIFQLEFLDKVPDYAVVDESVNLAKKFGHKGTTGLVNAVLRSYVIQKEKLHFPDRKRDLVSNLGVFYSYPDWMIKKWLDMFGEINTIKLAEFFNRKPRLSFRLNTLKTEASVLEECLKNRNLEFERSNFFEGFYILKSRISIEEWEAFQKGWIYFQDESAALAVYLLDPQPGEIILDLCSAPGGKLTFLLEKIKQKGIVIAVDKSLKKIKLLQDNLSRLGIKEVLVCQGDALNFSVVKADKVLLDAPCSGLGTLGRNPDARWNKKEEDLTRLQNLQLELMENASRLLKKKGVLVYSTCTLTREENQELIYKFLKKHKDFEIAPSKDFIKSTFIDEFGFVRSLPFEHNMDGAFCVRLEKK